MPSSKSRFLPGNGLQKLGFGNAHHPALVLAQGIEEVREEDVAVEGGLFPESGVAAVPGHGLGHVLRVDVLRAVIDHPHVALKGDHLVGEDPGHFFRRDDRLLLRGDRCGGHPEEDVQGMFVDIPVPEDRAVSPLDLEPRVVVERARPSAGRGAGRCSRSSSSLPHLSAARTKPSARSSPIPSR